MSNVTYVFFRGSVNCKTNPIYQHSYGQILHFSDIELPSTFEVHFSNDPNEEARTQIGENGDVDIPDMYLLSGQPVYFWIFLHTGLNDGETKFSGIIPVIKKSKQIPDSPMPVEQSVITQTIAALNDAVQRVESTSEEIQQTIAEALVEAKNSGEFDGEDGLDGKDGTDGADGLNGATFTPSVSPSGVLSWTNNGGLPNPESVNIKGAPGQNGLDGMDGVDGKDGLPGKDGEDGVSPAVTITSITGGHSVTITDADHPQGQIFNVMDGTPGTGISVHICSAAEYDSTTRVPTVQNPDTTTFYLVPAENAASPDMFVEWVYTNNAWELFGSARVEVPVQDVQVNGTSILNNGVANVPIANDIGRLGVVKIVQGSQASGLTIDGYGNIYVALAMDSSIKGGANIRVPIVPSNQHTAAFYGLAKAAGDTTQSQSSNAVGNYTESAKSAISTMLNSPVIVSGSTPSITALPGIQYVCGEVPTLDITLPASGCVDVFFESGSTPTALTITPPTGKTLSWTNDFDPTALEADTVYEINVAVVGDKCLGVAGQWA